jgi:hypothetical protein
MLVGKRECQVRLFPLWFAVKVSAASLSFHRYDDRELIYYIYSARRFRISPSFYFATTTGRTNASLLEG